MSRLCVTLTMLGACRCIGSGFSSTKNVIYQKLVWSIFQFFSFTIRDLRLQMDRSLRELSNKRTIIENGANGVKLCSFFDLGRDFDKKRSH
jgi:hypothetical protein